MQNTRSQNLLFSSGCSNLGCKTDEKNASSWSLARWMLPQDVRLGTLLQLAVGFSHYAHVQIVNEVPHIT